MKVVIFKNSQYINSYLNYLNNFKLLVKINKILKAYSFN
jgi:hypothetical protein